MRDKIPFYDIVNMFFIGAIFSMCALFLLYEYVPFDWFKENSELLSDWSFIISAVLLIAMYELGFIINRMGSIVVAPILERTGIWPKDDYDIDVSEISAKNSKFQSMLTELVLMRSHIMLCLILAGISIYQQSCHALLLFALLLFVFVLGGRKHNSKINIIRKSYVKNRKRSKNRSSTYRIHKIVVKNF